MSERKNEIKKFAGFSIASVVNLFIGIISVPITTRLLIPEQFGIAALYTTASEILFLFISFSSFASFERFYVEVDDKRKLLIHALFLPSILSIIIGILILFFGDKLSLLLFGKVNYQLTLLLFFTIGLRIFTEMSTTIIRMNSQAFLHSSALIFRRLAMLIATVSLLYFYKRNYSSVIIGSALTEILHAVFLFFFTRRYWNWRISDKLDCHLLNKLFHYALPLVPATMLTWIYNAIDKIVLRFLGDYNDIGLYSGAFKIVTILNILNLGIAHYWRSASLLWYRASEEKLKVRKVSEPIIFLTALSAVLLVMGKDLIILFLAKEYAASASLLPFLILTPVFGIFGLLTQVGLVYKKKTNIIFYISVVAALSNLLLSVILVKMYGIIGCAIATGFSSLLQFTLAGIVCSIIAYNYISLRTVLTVFVILITVVSTLFPGKLYLPAGAFSIVLLFFINTFTLKVIALEVTALARKLF